MVQGRGGGGVNILGILKCIILKYLYKKIYHRKRYNVQMKMQTMKTLIRLL